MRYIVFFMLLVNLAYFAWSYYQPVPELPDRQPPRPLLNNGLMLLREYQAESEAQALVNAEAERLCIRVTGFSTVDDANAFMLSARGIGLQTLLNLTGNSLDSQYRVYLAPASSRSIATIALDGLSEALNAAELEVETYLITRGLLENGIALGVFSDESNARDVSAAVAELGYEPQIDEIPRSDGEIEAWLRQPNSGRIGATEWLDLTAERLNLTYAENLCQTIAQASQFP